MIGLGPAFAILERAGFNWIDASTAVGPNPPVPRLHFDMTLPLTSPSF